MTRVAIDICTIYRVQSLPASPVALLAHSRRQRRPEKGKCPEKQREDDVVGPSQPAARPPVQHGMAYCTQHSRTHLIQQLL